MATTPITVLGSIAYTAPSFNYGATSQAINGGYSFDLPLATVAAFTNNAMSFANQNTANAQGFFSGVFNSGQAAVTRASDQAYAFQDKSLGVLQKMHQGALDVQKYYIKKQFGTMNMLKPGSQCFITTAVCKASGKSDNCWELQLLRKFRDDYLLQTPEGKLLVDIYYQVAPAIVEALDALPTASSAYAYLKGNFIDTALQRISVGDHKGATGIYTRMIEAAAKFAGIESLPVKVEVKPTPAPAKKVPAKRPQKPTATVKKRG